MDVNEDALDEIDAMYASDEDKKKKKKGKKTGKAATAAAVTEGEGGGAEKSEEKEAEPATVLTAAQKKKQKKERSKAAKSAQAKQQTQNQTKEETNTPKPSNDVAPAEAPTKGDESAAAAQPKDEEPANAEETEKKDDKKKKKKKKGAAGTAEESKEKAKEAARSKHTAKIRDILAKKKEEEERLRREEEERIRREEELRRIREEEQRKEQERKERKKQKDKERKMKLKAEGKLLTEKERQNRRRLQELVATRGLDLAAEEGEKKKRPRYEKLKKRNKQDRGQEAGDNAEAEQRESPEAEVAQKEEEDEDAKAGEEVEDDDEEDDWEKLADEDLGLETGAANDKVKDTLEEVEGSAEADEDEEDEESEEEEEEEDGDEDEESDSDEEEEEEENDPLEKARERIRARHVACERARDPANLRAPVVCVLGHVDTGKTKILDKLRRTHVQDGEAGGITQQIGATNVPGHAIMEATKMCKDFQKGGLQLPGLLIIDTPGHESFSNLRSRGSSLCDIAILVVDIMHGLEPQTIESIQLLKKRNTPFIVALNKIDRLFQWRTHPTNDVVNTLKKQQPHTFQEFNERVQNIIAEFAMQELNACLFYENNDLDEYISMVPTSAHSGDGMGNLLAYLCDFSQKRLTKRLAFSEDLEATVMEVKEITGLGTTIDVILVNGRLHENDHIIIAGQDRPIVTQIRGLLMPQPMKELRVKNAYMNHKEVVGAQGVKIIAKDLEKALAGLPLFSSENQFEQEVYCEEVSRGLKEILKGIQVSEKGVYVQASTLGSLEALLEFLRTSNIPYSSINIGPVHRRDVMKASVMLDRDPQWAVILAFDVKVEREAQEMADSLGVTIFTADIIYHLFDRFIKYRDDLKRANQEKFKSLAVFPVKLRILPQFIFNSRDPIVCGVVVEAGILKEGTPVCVPSKANLEIGRINSIESNKKPVQEARKGQEVCIKIAAPPGEAPKLYGRHFDHNDLLVSKISRESIDAVKDYFRDDLAKDDWRLMVELKKVLGVS